MPKVLLTGVSGFIGMPTARELVRRGYEVLGVCRRADFAMEGVRVRRADLLDRAQTDALLGEEKPDILMHLAWIATPGVYRDAPENIAWAREGLYLLERFARCGGSCAVMTGTCFEYDPTHGFMREDVTPQRPRTLYGAAKLSLSVLSRAWAERTGLPLAWARLFYLLGEREHEDRAVPYAIRAGLRGEEIHCLAPDAVRDYMSENEAARALCDVMASGMRGAVNIASGEGPAMREIFSFIANEPGARARLGNQKADPPSVLGDPRRLREEAGFIPRETWQQAALRCIAWRREEGTTRASGGQRG
jgi:nucleoside-diphosphate-sugar epimerase